MRASGVAVWAAAAVLAAGAPLMAQQRPAAPPPVVGGPEEILAPPPRPVTILVSQQASVTVAFAGDYGPLRVTGTLVGHPNEPLRLTDPAGRSREAAWTEVRDLALVRSASEGLPQGSYTVTLTSDPEGPSRTSTAPGGYISPALSAAGTGQIGWRLLGLPSGDVTLSAPLIGRMVIPTTRITDITMQPVSGFVDEMPKGTIRMEVLSGTVVGVPLQDIISLRRDTAAGTISVTLGDRQVFTGKLTELPQVSVQLTGTGNRPAIPLDRIVHLEIATPATSGSGSALGLQ